MQKLRKLMMKPLSGLDIIRNVGRNCIVLTYKDLPKLGSIFDVFRDNECIFLLYETKPNYGHWVLLLKHTNPENGLVYFEHFDSYSSFPDDELNFIPDDFRVLTKTTFPYLLYFFYKSGVEIHYNDYQLQKHRKGINTCGRWCLMRYLLRFLTIDEFNAIFRLVDDKDVFVTELTNVV